MSAKTFSDYAFFPALNPDATYTVELLIERVRDKFDPNYWDDWSERSDARESPDYKPQFSEEHVKPAEMELKVLSWLSFQRIRDAERPVRDLGALRFIPSVSGLVLSNNDILDISPIANCTNLKKLHLQKNPIRDISSLANCKKLEELELGETPIEDFSVLETLPNLRELSISVDQIPAFRRLTRLQSFKKIEFGLDTFDSFEGFPEMPKLRVIRGAHVKRLDGLQRFPKLENLVNLSGDFDTLEPLANSKALTHANILGSRVRSVEPLSALVSLRDLCLNTDALMLDLSPLESLPALHELTVKCNGEELTGLDKFRATLEPWDVEFRAPKPRHTPSLELDIVDQEIFDVYDTEKPYNVTKSDANAGLLSSELEWLDAQIDDVLSVSFEEDEDYTIPFQWGGARSRTVVLLSQKAIEAFPRLVLGIQKVLSTAKKDWIIYFQSDDDEFIVWIYPDKIMVTKENAKNVRKLIKPN